MRYLKWLLLSMALLMPVGAKADDHAHVWGETRCPFPWDQVGRCRQRTCLKTCTYAGCLATVPVNQTECSHSAAPVSIWGPRPGSSGSGECPPHDFGEEVCSGWSEMHPGCKVRHCTRRCSKCGSNGRDRLDDSPPGCF